MNRLLRGIFGYNEEEMRVEQIKFNNEELELFGHFTKRY